MKLIMENWKKFLNEEPIEEWTKEQVQAILAGDDPGPEKSEMFASPPEAPRAPACDPEEDAIDVRILDAAAAALEGSDLADQIDCLKQQIVRAFEGDDEGEDYGGEREKNIAGVFGQIERLVREALNESKKYEYDEPTHVRGYKTKKGTYVKPHASKAEVIAREYETEEEEELTEKKYKTSPGAAASLKKHGGSCKKAVKAGKFDWADEPYAVCNAAKITTQGHPTVPRGSKFTKSKKPGGKGRKLIEK